MLENGFMTSKKNNGQQSHLFSVSLNYAQCEDLYRHQIKFLQVTSIEGKRIRLPKQNMQKFITPSGLQGNYELIVDQNNKFLSINKLN